MSFSNPDEPSPIQGQRFADANERSDAAEMDPELLKRVIEQTASMAGPDKPLGSANGAALRELASRYRGQQFALEPILVEMVSIALRPQLAGTSIAPKDWENLTTRVAQTLYEDPPSRERLEAFWQRLSGA